MSGLEVRRVKDRWYVWGHFMGRRVRRSTGLFATPANYPRAEKVRKAVEDDLIRLGYPKPKPKNRRYVSDAVSAYMATKGLGPGDTGFRTLAAIIEKFGRRFVDQVGTPEIQAWVDAKWRKPNGEWRVTGNTVRREMVPVVAIWRAEWLAGYCERPLSLDLPPIGDGRETWLTMEQAKTVIEMDKDTTIYPFFTILLTTGCRPNEAVKLQWEQVDMTRREIVFSTGKGNSGSKAGQTRKRRVPMTDTLYEALKTINPHGKSSGYVVMNANGRPMAEADNPSATQWYHWEKIRKAIGREDVNVYDLRHTYASLLVASDVDLRVVADLLGHSRLERTRRYAHLQPSKLHKEVSKLGL